MIEIPPGVLELTAMAFHPRTRVSVKVEVYEELPLYEEVQDDLLS